LTKYIKRTDGDGFTVPLGEIHRIACCDCGLVHDVVWVYVRGKLGMAVRRNARATAQKRREKKLDYVRREPQPAAQRTDDDEPK
jgi:hypothetical protein